MTRVERFETHWSLGEDLNWIKANLNSITQVQYKTQGWIRSTGYPYHNDSQQHNWAIKVPTLGGYPLCWNRQGGHHKYTTTKGTFSPILKTLNSEVVFGWQERSWNVMTILYATLILTFGSPKKGRMCITNGISCTDIAERHNIWREI